MRKLGMISAVALLITAGNAFAFTAVLSVGGNSGIIDVDADTGGTFDVRIDFNRDGSTNNIGGGQTDFVADASGITINGSAGGTTLAGTGTRYNQNEWDASTAGNAQNPNTSLAGPMTPGNPRGVMGTLYTATEGVWDSSLASSFFGILNITIAPGTVGNLITLSTINTFLSDIDILDDVPVAPDPVTFQYVPEPATALLLLAAAPFMRRRRTA